MIRFLEYAAIFLLLLVLQEFVFDNINLGGMVNPYIYIMFIILLPLDIPGWGLLLLGFGAGGAVDVMEGTAGLQTMTATWLAFARPTVVGLLLGKDLVYEGDSDGGAGGNGQVSALSHGHGFAFQCAVFLPRRPLGRGLDHSVADRSQLGFQCRDYLFSPLAVRQHETQGVRGFGF